MPIAVSCPTCAARFSVADELYKRRFAGRIVTVRCKHCQSAIRFDASEPPVDAKPAHAPAPEPARIEQYVPRRPPAPPRPPQPARPGVVALSPGLLETAHAFEEEDEKTRNIQVPKRATHGEDPNETVDVTEFARSEPPPAASDDGDLTDSDAALPQGVSPGAVDENFLIGLRGDSRLSAALASPALPQFEEVPGRVKSDTTSPVSRSGVPRHAAAARRARRVWAVAFLAVPALGLAGYLALLQPAASDAPLAQAPTPAALHRSDPGPTAPRVAPPPAAAPAPDVSASNAPSAASASSNARAPDAPLNAIAPGTSAVTQPSVLRPSAETATGPTATATATKPESLRASSESPASLLEKSAQHPEEPETPTVTEPFDRSAAVTALTAAALQASECKKPNDPSGTASVTVIFAPSGRVTSATLSGPPFAGTQTGGCIAASLRRARVPAFAGDSVTVSKTVNVR